MKLLSLSSFLVLIMVGIVCPMVAGDNSPWLRPPGSSQYLDLGFVSQDKHDNHLLVYFKFYAEKGPGNEPIVTTKFSFFNFLGKGDSISQAGDLHFFHGLYLKKISGFEYEVGYDVDSFTFGKNNNKHTGTVFPRVNLKYVWNSKGYYEITAANLRQGMTEVCYLQSTITLPGESNRYAQPNRCIHY